MLPSLQIRCTKATLCVNILLCFSSRHNSVEVMLWKAGWLCAGRVVRRFIVWDIFGVLVVRKIKFSDRITY